MVGWWGSWNDDGEERSRFQVTSGRTVEAVTAGPFSSMSTSHKLIRFLRWWPVLFIVAPMVLYFAGLLPDSMFADTDGSQQNIGKTLLGLLILGGMLWGLPQFLSYPT